LEVSAAGGARTAALRHIKKGGHRMSIASDLIRGHTETIILAQLSEGDSYGYQINKAIRRKTDDRYELKEATLYTAFKRLEELGCITSYWGDENSGARRKYYSITPYGRATYERLLFDWNAAKQLIDRLIDGGKSR
jgi:DNA-binding PadR family transcriptional regulator